MTKYLSEVTSGRTGTRRKTRQEYEVLRSQLQNERQSFVPHWKELNDHIFPRRGRFTLGDVNKGDRRTQKIIDGTATFAARTCASGMMTGITSPAREWFRLTTPDPALAELPAVKYWLHEVTQRLRTAFLRSNLYTALSVVYLDLVVFGTAALFSEEDDESGMRFTVFPCGSYAIGTDAHGRVRSLVREFTMTSEQLAGRFGLKNLSSGIVAALQRDPFDQTRHEVVHIVVENPDYDESKVEARHKPFVSCYYEKASTDQRVLKESGYDEFPLFAPRWSVTGEDVYGTDCPGMTALGDIKQLQFGEKMGAKALEKSVNPPLVGPTELKSVRVSHLPGDVTYSDTVQNNGLRPIHEVRPDIAGLENKQSQIRARIERAFYADLFLMLSYMDAQKGRGTPPTATEINVRQEEKLLALGPVLEQQNQDLLDPLIDRGFAILLRRGELPDPPPELEGVDLKVEYISIMHAAQKAAGLGTIERTARFAVDLATASQDVSVLDKIDLDQTIDEYALAAGSPPRMVRPDEDVAAMRESRAEMQRQAQQAQVAKDASQSAKNLSETDTRGENALTDLLAGVA